MLRVWVSVLGVRRLEGSALSGVRDTVGEKYACSLRRMGFEFAFRHGGGGGGGE